MSGSVPVALSGFPADGMLLRYNDSGIVYLIVGGAHIPVPDPTILAQLDPDGSRTMPIPEGALDFMSTTPRDGTLVRYNTSGSVYLTLGSSRIGVPDPPTWNQLDSERQADAAGLGRCARLSAYRALETCPARLGGRSVGECAWDAPDCSGNTDLRYPRARSRHA